MNRFWRNTLAFGLGLILGCFTVLAYADTVPASLVWKYISSDDPSGKKYDSAEAAFVAAFPAEKTYRVCSWGSVGPSPSVDAGCTVAYPGSGQAYVFSWNGYFWSRRQIQYLQFTDCPSGQNWTLSGTTCTRPDCVSPEVRNTSTGICEAPVCPTSSTSGWYTVDKGQNIAGTYCTGGCEYSLSLDLSAPLYYTSSKKTWLYMTRYGEGKSCSGGATAPEGVSTPPNTPEKAAPCAATEGVISNSTGKVSCVPSATPGADTAKQTQKTSTEKFSDGSSKITTTTTTCTGEGACSTNITTTTTSNSSGVAGQAGTPGTSTKSTDKAPSETPDFCAQNPTLQICKGVMNEEATQKKIQEAIEKLSKPEVSDDSALSGLTFGKTTGYEDMVKSDETLQKYATGELVPNGLATAKNAWESTMASGWFDPIPMTGCTPPTFSVDGRSLDLSKWCTHADTISEIGSYALWFLFATGVFVMMTGGKREGA